MSWSTVTNGTEHTCEAVVLHVYPFHDQKIERLSEATLAISSMTENDRIHMDQELGASVYQPKENGRGLLMVCRESRNTNSYRFYIMYNIGFRSKNEIWSNYEFNQLLFCITCDYEKKRHAQRWHVLVFCLEWQKDTGNQLRRLVGRTYRSSDGYYDLNISRGNNESTQLFGNHCRRVQDKCMLTITSNKNTNNNIAWLVPVVLIPTPLLVFGLYMCTRPIRNHLSLWRKGRNKMVIVGVPHRTCLC